MENISRYRSLEAFCRQRARTVEETADVWLEKANILSRLAAAEIRSKAPTIDEDNSSPLAKMR